MFAERFRGQWAAKDRRKLSDCTWASSQPKERMGATNPMSRGPLIQRVKDLFRAQIHTSPIAIRLEATSSNSSRVEVIVLSKTYSHL